MKVDIYELNDDNVANVIEYDAEKAEMYYKEKERKFMKTCLPKEIKRINRWFNSNPKTKHDTIVEKLLKDYKAKLKESCFFSYYVITQDDIDIFDMFNDFSKDPYFFVKEEEHVEYVRFEKAFDTVYEYADSILNIEKIERYVWENQNKLTDEQIWAFMAYDAVKKYLLDNQQIQDNNDVDDNANANAETSVDTDITSIVVNEKLDTIFNSELRCNKQASEKFLELMPEVIQKAKTRKGKRTNKWRWPHVFYALNDKRLNFIVSNTKVDFGKAMAKLDNSLNACNISHTFQNNNCKNFPTEIDKNIITEIVLHFQPVKSILKKEEQ